MKRRVLLIILIFLVAIAIDQLWIKGGKMTTEKKKAEESSMVTPRHSIPHKDIRVAVEKEVSIESPSVEKPEEIKITPPQPSMTERLSELGGQIGDPIFIRIFKYTAELELWIKVKDRYELLHTYEVCRQSGYLGPKLKEGDKQGPEGFYYVTKNRLNPNSKFHLSFNLGYPNTYDRVHKRTGSALMVHGNCVSIGCFAMTDEKIEEIYELVEKALGNGQKVVRVHIFPFRMTDTKMNRYRSNQWYGFWKNLKEGYDYFEEKGTPPNVEVEKKRYVFSKSR